MQNLYADKEALSSKPKVISFVATRSGTGKTTLIEQVIEILKAEGLKVGVLKHDGHDFEIDHEQKDSWRFGKAGADTVMVASAYKVAKIQKVPHEIPVENLIEQIEGVDLIIVEGYKKSQLPKIEVHRKGVDEKLLHQEWAEYRGTFVAVATDEVLKTDLIQLDLNDPKKIAAFIVNGFSVEKTL